MSSRKVDQPGRRRTSCCRRRRYQSRRSRAPLPPGRASQRAPCPSLEHRQSSGERARELESAKLGADYQRPPPPCVQAGRLTWLDWELPFRWHIGGDLGQSIKLGNQHCSGESPPRPVCEFLLCRGCSAGSSGEPRLSRTVEAHVAVKKTKTTTQKVLRLVWKDVEFVEGEVKSRISSRCVSKQRSKVSQVGRRR